MGALDRMEPFSSVASSWQRDIDRMFRSLAESFGGGSLASRRTDWMPAADVLKHGDDVVIRIELPGIDPAKDLEITVEDDTLHMRGERQETEEEKREGFIRRETSYGAFERALPIPSGARTEDVKATYSDGILEVVVPGAAKRSTQRVPVEVGSEKKKK